MAKSFFRHTVIEIDLDAITDNLKFFKNKLASSTELMAVVKADAYGHGAIPVATHLQSLGVKYFAVAFLDEAIQLRKAGIQDRILILGYTPSDGIELACKYDIALTVYTLDTIKRVEEVGERLGKEICIHLKVDTGMGRIGLAPKDIDEYIDCIKEKKWIKLEGIYTHFATADEKDKSLTFKQYKSFSEVVSRVEKTFNLSIIHASNSAAAIDLAELSQTMVRIGIGLYGLAPSEEVDLLENDLKPVMTIKTEVIYVKTISPGQTVSYGATFKATRETKVATLPIGYADGFSRSLSNRGYVIVHGVKVPIIGRICMDQTMIDVTEIDDVQIGDEVIIVGSQNGQYITMDYNAKLLNTINYELVTLLGKRIPRIYKQNGNIVEIVNNLTSE